MVDPADASSYQCVLPKDATLTCSPGWEVNPDTRHILHYDCFNPCMAECGRTFGPTNERSQCEQSCPSGYPPRCNSGYRWFTSSTGQGYSEIGYTCERSYRIACKQCGSCDGKYISATAISCNQEADSDKDGRLCNDNCPSDYNPDQEDWDMDSIGNVCDPSPGYYRDSPGYGMFDVESGSQGQ